MSGKPMWSASGRPGVDFPVEAVLIAAAVFVSPLIAGKLAVTRSLVVQALVFAAAMIWIIRGAGRGRLGVPPVRLVWLSAALFALAALSALRTVGLHATLLELANLGCCLLLFLMIGGMGSRSALHGILAALMVAAVIVGAVGLKEYLLAPSPGWRVFSTFFNPDFLAGFAALVLPVALAWYLSDTSPGISFASGLAVLLSCAALLMTGSRFGFAAAVGGILVFTILALLSRSFGKSQAVRLGLIVLPVLVVFLLLGRPLAGRVASARAESYSGGFRIETWKGTLRMARAHPVVGTGLGTFELVYPRYAGVGWTKLAHNSYLQLAAEAGFAAPVLLIVLLASSLFPPVILLLRRGVRDEPGRAGGPGVDLKWTPGSALLLSGLLGGAAASMARNLVDSDWYVTAVGTSFWAVAGAAVVLGSTRESPGIRLRRSVAWVTGTAVGLSTVGLLLLIAGRMFAARGAALAGNCEMGRAVAAYRRAAFLDPLDAENCRALAGVYVAVARGSGDLDGPRRAKRLLVRAARLEPTSAKNYYQLGRLYAESFLDDAGAVRAFRWALERDPHSTRVLLALARAYERLGREGRALDVYRRMVEVERSPYERIRAMPELVDPAYAFAHYALGRRLERRGDGAGAVGEYDAALDRIRRYEVSMETMGPILESQGMRDYEMDEQVATLKADLERRLERRGGGAHGASHSR